MDVLLVLWALFQVIYLYFLGGQLSSIVFFAVVGPNAIFEVKVNSFYWKSAFLLTNFLNLQTGACVLLLELARHFLRTTLCLTASWIVITVGVVVGYLMTLILFVTVLTWDYLEFTRIRMSDYYISVNRNSAVFTVNWKFFTYLVMFSGVFPSNRLLTVLAGYLDKATLFYVWYHFHSYANRFAFCSSWTFNNLVITYA
jgi:hypothetical protein